VATADEVAAQLGGEERLVAVTFDVEGELAGRLVLVWSEANARVFTQLLLRGVPPGGTVLEEPRRSALSESANILASACLTAIGRLTGLRVLPSPPRLSLDSSDWIMGELFGNEAYLQDALVLQTRFVTSNVPALTGQLLLVSDGKSLARLFRSLGL
jgi:chemotaxis protein CheC